MPKQPKRPSRFLPLLAVFLIPAAVIAHTEPSSNVEAIDEADYARVPDDTFRLPDNLLSIGIRLTGSAKVDFSGLGTIPNSFMPTADVASEILRIYADGFVGVSARVDANGNPLPPDGRTNVWKFDNNNQIASDRSGIFFANYATLAGGATAKANSGPTPGFDIEVSRRIGGEHIKWGAQVGLGLTDINAKTTGDITASLRRLRDFYSLLGAAPPDAPYEAPVFSSTIVTNPDGSTTTVITDISVLLAGIPTNRSDTITSNAAQINGFWQVRGAYFTARLGPWIELPITERITVRASGGVSGTVLGAFMRFDERFLMPDGGGELTAADQTSPDSWGMFGGFAALEAQWWLTERSGFFAGATYEAVSGDAELKSGDRTARMNVESGAGVRFGFTTRF